MGWVTDQSRASSLLPKEVQPVMNALYNRVQFLSAEHLLLQAEHISLRSAA